MGNHAGNKTGNRLDYKQEIPDEVYDRAKAECAFTDRLYEILLAYQRGQIASCSRPQGIPDGNVGELNPRMSRLYNQIWATVMGLQERAKQKKKQGVIAA